jgi:hypothetical protein
LPCGLKLAAVFKVRLRFSKHVGRISSFLQCVYFCCHKFSKHVLTSSFRKIERLVNGVIFRMSSTSASPGAKKMASKEKGVLAPPKDEATNPLVQRQASSDTWMMLLAFRFTNVLCVATFFQPDEYFQSLEPAWQMAFGSQSGAWITWVRSRSFWMRIGSDNFTGMATSTPFLFASCIFCSCVLSRRQFYEARELFPSVPGHDLVYSSKCGSGNLRCHRRLLYVAISRENVWDREQVYFGSREWENAR